MEKLCRSVRTLYLLPKTNQINLRLIATVSNTTNGLAHLSKSSLAFRCLSSSYTELFSKANRTCFPQARNSSSVSHGQLAEFEGDEVTEYKLVDPLQFHAKGLDFAMERLERTIALHSQSNLRDYEDAFDRFTRKHQIHLINDALTDKLKSELAFVGLTLLKSCGALMVGTKPAIRQELAGALWTFLKEKELPLDTLHYNYLLATLNDNETSYDPQKIIDEMTAAGLQPNRLTYQRAIHQYCLQGDISQSTSLLEKMRSLGMTLNEQIFASLIIGYSKQTDSPPIDELLELMETNGITPGGLTYSTAISTRIQMSQSNPSAIEDLKNIIQRMKNEEICLSLSEGSQVLSSLGPIKDHELGIALRDNILGSLPKSSYKFIQTAIDALMAGGQFEAASKLYWTELNPPNSTKPPGSIRSNGLVYARCLASHDGVSVEHVMSEGDRLIDAEHVTEPFHYMYYVAAEQGKLDIVRGCLKKISADGRVKVHYIWPLIAQAKNDDELVQALKENLVGKFSVSAIKETLVSWVWGKYSHNSSLFLELDKKTGLDRYVIEVSYIEHLISQNQLEEAIKRIRLINIPDRPVEQNSSDQANNEKPPRVQVGNFVYGRLSGMIEESGDAELFAKFEKICRPILNRFPPASDKSNVSIHIEAGDYDAALKAFIESAETQGLTPRKEDLMKHFLENQDPEGLQKIIAAATKVYGQMNTLFDLALVCFDLGQYQQAQKIIRSPGFRVNPDRIYRYLDAIAEGGSTERLENYVHQVKHLIDVDSERLYMVLLECYRKKSLAERTLELWNLMQEDSKLSKKVLQTMANVLRENGLPVPFEKLGY